MDEIHTEYKDYFYRTPIKFGGNVLDRVTMLNVHAVVSTAGGKSAKGYGSMPIGNVWAFPSKEMSYETTLNAMKTLSERIEKLTGDCKESGHPIDINTVLEPAYLKAAEEVSAEQKLLAPIPKLATLVTASPFDAAIHDAYGKLHGLNCYHTYGPEFMNYDLAHYLDDDFKGEYLDSMFSRNPRRACRSTT